MILCCVSLENYFQLFPENSWIHFNHFSTGVACSFLEGKDSIKCKTLKIVNIGSIINIYTVCSITTGHGDFMEGMVEFSPITDR